MNTEQDTEVAEGYATLCANIYAQVEGMCLDFFESRAAAGQPLSDEDRTAMAEGACKAARNALAECSERRAPTLEGLHAAVVGLEKRVTELEQFPAALAQAFKAAEPILPVGAPQGQAQ